MQSVLNVLSEHTLLRKYTPCNWRRRQLQVKMWKNSHIHTCYALGELHEYWAGLRCL